MWLWTWGMTSRALSTFMETLTSHSVLLAIGTIYRIIACALLILVKRSKQR